MTSLDNCSLMAEDLAQAIVGESVRLWGEQPEAQPFTAMFERREPSTGKWTTSYLDVTYPDPAHIEVGVQGSSTTLRARRDKAGEFKEVLGLMLLMVARKDCTASYETVKLVGCWCELMGK